jgi:drug/metabolite transporter (DMT)-like permease
MKAILCAFLAAVFYSINIPASKMLLREVGPTTMAALLYLGAVKLTACVSCGVANHNEALMLEYVR